MRLDKFNNAGFDRGSSWAKEFGWLITSGLLVASWIPGSRWRVALLRRFGATIGQNVVIKPGVQIKFPWKLDMGDHCWIGEHVWIDNLAQVTLGNHVCISQGAYLCTGSHDWAREAFDLITKPINIEDHAWICARALLAPGTTVQRGAVLGIGAVGHGTIEAWVIVQAPGLPTRSRPNLVPKGVE